VNGCHELVLYAFFHQSSYVRYCPITIFSLITVINVESHSHWSISVKYQYNLTVSNHILVWRVKKL